MIEAIVITAGNPSPIQITITGAMATIGTVCRKIA